MEKNQLKKAKEHAKSKGGICNSSEYINCDTKLEWSCGKDAHPNWNAAYSKVVYGNRWCPKCKIENISDRFKNKNGLKLAKEHAKSKKGFCLSTEYINSRTKMEWKCNDTEHSSWFSSYGNVVKTGTWCPKFGSSRNVQENRVRNILNFLFKTKFIKTKADWNINPETNRCLELDGYCKKLNKAFEYQGEHHFLTSAFNSIEKLAYTKRKDQYKKENCDKNGVNLIIINFIKNGNCFNLFMNEIDRAIIDAKIKCSNNNNYDLDKLKEIFNTTIVNNIQKENFLNAQTYAKSKNGECLSKKYINARSSMEWKCYNSSHPSWFSSYNSVVKTGTWCSKCGDEKTSIKQRNSDGLKKAQEYCTI